MRNFIDIVEGKAGRPFGRSVPFGGLYFKKMDEQSPLHDCQNDRYLVMFPDGTAAGHMWIDRCSYREKGWWTIHREVVTDHQRKGIGKIMLDFADQRAAEAGTRIVPSIHLSQASRNFWRKHAPDRIDHPMTEDKHPRRIAGLTDQERHEFLKFIYEWLTGSYMHHADKPQSENVLSTWRALATRFPPKPKGPTRLYRLITVPEQYAHQEHFRIKPAPAPVSSWTSKLVGLDNVAGVADEFGDDKGTARIAISAIIEPSAILATPVSIREAFLGLSHDYFDRYKEVEKKEVRNGNTYGTTIFPGYPGGESSLISFSMWDLGYMRAILEQFRGGHLRQWEYVVATPPVVDATLVRVYRIGDRHLRQGNDDPHN